MGQPTAETEIGDQTGRLRSPGQHRLRADVDRVPRHLSATELPAHHIRCVEDDDSNVVALQQLPRRCQSRDSAADDGDDGGGHASTVAAEPLWNGLGSLECPEG